MSDETDSYTLCRQFTLLEFDTIFDVNRVVKGVSTLKIRKLTYDYDSLLTTVYDAKMFSIFVYFIQSQTSWLLPSGLNFECRLSTVQLHTLMSSCHFIINTLHSVSNFMFTLVVGMGLAPSQVFFWSVEGH